MRKLCKYCQWNNDKVDGFCCLEHKKAYELIHTPRVPR